MRTIWLDHASPYTADRSKRSAHAVCGVWNRGDCLPGSINTAQVLQQRRHRRHKTHNRQKAEKGHYLRIADSQTSATFLATDSQLWFLTTYSRPFLPIVSLSEGSARRRLIPLARSL